MKKKEIYHPEFIQKLKDCDSFETLIDKVLELFDNNYRHLGDYCIFLIKNNFIEFGEQFRILFLMLLLKKKFGLTNHFKLFLQIYAQNCCKRQLVYFGQLLSRDELDSVN